MKIIQAPNAVLSAKAKAINKIDKDILALIEEMKITLLTASDPEGVGLAAPQVGKSLQLFLMKTNNEAPFHIFINPEVTLITEEKEAVKEKPTKKQTRLEGCLSLKDIWGTVHRAPKVRVKYLDESGKMYDKVFSGFPATIVQHEKDHLDGILFPKRVLEQKGKLYKSHKDENGEDIFEVLKLA